MRRSRGSPAAGSAAEGSTTGSSARSATLAASATLGSAARTDHASWTSTRDPDLKAQLKDRGEVRAAGAQATAVAGLVALSAGAYFVWTF